MSINATLTPTITLSDGAATMSKVVPAMTYQGINTSYVNVYSVLQSGATTVTIPKSPVQFVHVRNLSAAGVSAPVAAPTLSSVAGGTIAQTTYFVKITYVNPTGETDPSTESSLLVLVNNLLVVLSPPALGTATSYNVYVSTTTNTETLQNASPIAIGTNWTLPTSGLVSGASLPVANTTANVLSVTWTKQGGTSAGVLDLWPGAAIEFSEPTSAGGFNAASAIGGITALSLISSITGGSCATEVIIAG